MRKASQARNTLLQKCLELVRPSHVNGKHNVICRFYGILGKTMSWRKFRKTIAFRLLLNPA
jgi:hypothetical protein